MSELDKKIQKSQPDLVQSVLEAQEKRNVDRVDVLITNALKQLKMSRFKPDQATCLSLIYLARISPKSFSQSANLKELLKSHLRRDNGPTNMKAVIKNDFILPVLAANILLACSDTPEVRAIILKRIEQWLSSNQKIIENVQHLLAILCVRCQGDTQTVSTLIDMRHHWFNCFELPSSSDSSVALDLCYGIRKLLHHDNSCDSLIENLKFLYKHDRDTIGLAKDISRSILHRPITIKSMLDREEHGEELRDMLLLVYNKFFEQLKFMTKKAEDNDSLLFYKLPDVKNETCQPNSQIVTMEQNIIEAILTLLSSIEIKKVQQQDYESLFDFFSKAFNCNDDADAIFYKNSELTSPYDMPSKLRNRLVLCDFEPLIRIGLNCATPAQLVEMLHQFGFPRPETVDEILSRLAKLSTELDDLGKFDIKDPLYLDQLLEFYESKGIEFASAFREKLNGNSDSKNQKVITKIKVEA